MPEWLEEGYFVRLTSPEYNTQDFYFIDQTERARYVFDWPVSIASNTENGPQNVEDLKPMSLNRLYQGVFGIATAALIYLNLPLNTRLWGTDKKPIATSSLRMVGFRDIDESPYNRPSFVTEFFLMKDGSFDFPAFTAFNPTDRALTPSLNILLNKTVTTKITDQDTLDLLKKKRIPYRPITLGGLSPVRTGLQTT